MSCYKKGSSKSRAESFCEFLWQPANREEQGMKLALMLTKISKNTNEDTTITGVQNGLRSTIWHFHNLKWTALTSETCHLASEQDRQRQEKLYSILPMCHCPILEIFFSINVSLKQYVILCTIQQTQYCELKMDFKYFSLDSWVSLICGFKSDSLRFIACSLLWFKTLLYL